MLNRSGILKTNRGYQGGYKLARSPESCTVGEILMVTEGNLAPVSCLENEINECPRAGECMTLFIWEELHKRTTDYLNSITVKDVIDRANNNNDYVI